MTTHAWDAPPITLDLPPNEVHVWRVSLAAAAGAAHEASLSPDELARAERFLFDRDRQRYIAARGSLRSTLGRYLGCPPIDLAFEYGPQGKPALAAPCDRSVLTFNLTHADDLALVAVARRRRVGIDIERIREIPEASGIARRYFTAAEAATLATADHPGTAFMRLWTRKEAVIKAVGVGLSMPLNCFDLSEVPGDGTMTFVVDDITAEGREWTLHELFPGPEYSAAVVIEGAGCLRQFAVG